MLSDHSVRSCREWVAVADRVQKRIKRGGGRFAAAARLPRIRAERAGGLRTIGRRMHRAITHGGNRKDRRGRIQCDTRSEYMRIVTRADHDIGTRCMMIVMNRWYLMVMFTVCFAECGKNQIQMPVLTHTDGIMPRMARHPGCEANSQHKNYVSLLHGNYPTVVDFRNEEVSVFYFRKLTRIRRIPSRMAAATAVKNWWLFGLKRRTSPAPDRIDGWRCRYNGTDRAGPATL